MLNWAGLRPKPLRCQFELNTSEVSYLELGKAWVNTSEVLALGANSWSNRERILL